jgi:CRISPR-associated protein Cas2
METRLYLILYDVACPKRWRRVYKTLRSHGAWQQLSAFACRARPRDAETLKRALIERIDARADRLMVVDLGPDPDARRRIEQHGRGEALPAARPRIF